MDLYLIKRIMYPFKQEIIKKIEGLKNPVNWN